MSAPVGTRPPLQYLHEELEKLKEQKLYQKLRVLSGEQLPVATFDGQRVINLSSNNYLGLTTHRALKKAAAAAIKTRGVGPGGGGPHPRPPEHHKGPGRKKRPPPTQQG